MNLLLISRRPNASVYMMIVELDEDVGGVAM